MQWEYAQLYIVKGIGEVDGVAFSHPQPDGVVPYVKERLGRKMKERESNARFWHLNMAWSGDAPMPVLEILGNMGWEMVGMATHPGGHVYYVLKRQRPPAA